VKSPFVARVFSPCVSNENVDIKFQMATSQIQGDLNFAFDQRKSEVNLHNAISSPEKVALIAL
jgi:hypothetical protein